MLHKKPSSSRANLKPEFCFVEEKEPRKSPKNRKPVEKQQKISDGSADAEFAEDGIENNDIELDIKGCMIVYMFKK